MNKFWVIASDVYKKNVKSLSFLIMILLPFVVLGIIYLASTLADSFGDRSDIGVVAENAALLTPLTAQKSEDYRFVKVDSLAKAKQKLNKESLDGILILTEENHQLKGELLSVSGLGATVEMGITQLLNQIQYSQNIGQLQLDAEQVATLSQQAAFSRKKVSFDDKGKMVFDQTNTDAQQALSFVVTIALWIVIITYASIIAQEIASEKGSRIMEVILSSTRAQTHFYGKLVGILLVVLTQIAVYAAVFSVGYSQLKNLDLVKQFVAGISFDKILGSYLVITLLLFIIGIFAYSVLAALCGSLVSKPEDTAKAVQPIMYIAMIGYFIGLTLGVGDPQNIVIKVSSYIPLVSSFIMPIRLANETVSTMGAGISVALLLVFTIFLTLFSARLYKSNVLVYSEGGVIKSLQQSISILKNERKKA